VILPCLRLSALTLIISLVTTVESLLNVRTRSKRRTAKHGHPQISKLTLCTLQADPKLGKLKDDDGRLPIHWAASSNQHAIALMLANQKGFEPDPEACQANFPLLLYLRDLTLMQYP